MLDKKTILSLQAIRALAYMLIFLCHMYIVPTIWAGLGVSVFIVMSGFLMVCKHYDHKLNASFKGCVDFMISKIKKLYGLHILTMIAALLLVVVPAIKGTVQLDYSTLIIKVLLNVVLLQAWVPDSSIYFSLNGVSWYLSLAVFLYMMFPLLLSKMQKHRGHANVYVTIIVTVIMQISGAWILQQLCALPDGGHNITSWFTYICPLYRLGDFVIGCNIGYIFVNMKKECANKTKTLIEICSIAITMLSMFIASYFVNLQVYSVVYFLPIAVMLVFVFAQENGRISMLISNRLLVSIGNLSAYTFLIHQIVIRYCKLFLPRIIDLEINIFLMTMIAFVITWIVAILYEKLKAWKTAKLCARL